MKTISSDSLASVFAFALIEVVSKISGFSFDILPEVEDSLFCDTVAFMSLGGNKGGVVFITADDASIRVLHSFVVGGAVDEVTKADTQDLLSEILNMAAGNAKLHLNDTEFMFNLSSPIVLSGDNMVVSVKKRVNMHSRVLAHGDIFLKLLVVV